MLENFVPTVLKTFGGLCTYIDRVAMRLGLSPDCQNVRFAPGMVATRDGYGVALTDAEHPFVGVSQLIRTNGDRHLIVLSDRGRLRSEFPGGTLTQLEDEIARDAHMRTASLFSTQYMCFSDGKLGVAPMRRYDGATLAPVGVGAPGKAPTLAESATAGTGLLAGVHCCVVVFVNKYGDVSGWSPVTSATFAGGKKVNVTVPLGPPDTVQRYVGLTPKDDGANFMITSKLVVGDNTTATPITFDISEDELLESKESLSRWITSYVPWMPAGCASYQERLLVWGARPTLQPIYATDAAISLFVLQNYGLRNASFDGGFTGSIPNGWSAVGSGQSAGGSGTALDGRCLRITGDGASASRGEIAQAALNTSGYISASGRYGVSVLARSSVWATGKLNVELSAGPVGGPMNVLLLVQIPLPIDPVSAWQLIDTEMGVLVGTQHAAVQMRVWASDGPMPATGWVDCSIAVYDANDTQYYHTLAVSDSGRPGTFVGEAGIVSIGPDDGEGIRNVFRIRDSLYVAKERSLHALSNTSTGDPVTWGVDLVDAFGGTPSLHGVAPGDGYVVIAGRDGLRMFDGGMPRLVSRLIEPTWRSADWLRGERVVVVLDPSKEIVRVALPVTTDDIGASMVLAADFKGGWDDGGVDGGGLKWSRDVFAGNGTTRVLAGTLALSGAGSHVPVFSVVGETVQNEIVNSRDFSGWTFPGTAPTVTSVGIQDGRTGANATRWEFPAASTYREATYPLPANPLGRSNVTVSLRIKSTLAMPVTLSLAGAAPSTTTNVPAGLWTRVVATFWSGAITPGSLVTLRLGPVPPPFAAPGDFAWVYAVSVDLADLQVAYQTERADWGFADTAAGASGENECALLVYPVPLLRRDFAGRIRMRYETGMLGQEVGRSTFDRCLVRAVGNGYLSAAYSGLGSRSWAMIDVQLTDLPDEDIEFGADMKSSAATLVLSSTSEDGWVIVKSVAVATSPLGVGWARGRNG